MRGQTFIVFIIFVVFGAAALRSRRAEPLAHSNLNSSNQSATERNTGEDFRGNSQPNTTTEAAAEMEPYTENGEIVSTEERYATQQELETPEKMEEARQFFLTSDFIEEAGEMSGSFLTTSSYEGETVLTFLPAPAELYTDAPFYPFTDSHGETYVAQILESQESTDGADYVTFNLGGDPETVEATLTIVPYGISVDLEGEVVVDEVAESCFVHHEEPETVLEIPEVIAETDVPTHVEITPVEGESSIVILLPNTGDIIPNAPFVPVYNEETETTYIAQVLESYESSTGEHLVTINVGEGESITVEGEIVESDYLWDPVVTPDGEIEVIEASEVTTNEHGETVFTIPTENGETEEVIAEPIVDVSAVTPDQIICLPPGHAEEETTELESTLDYEPPTTCEAPQTTTETGAIPNTIEEMGETTTEEVEERTPSPSPTEEREESNAQNLPDFVSDMGEATENVLITTANIDGEEIPAIVPDPTTIIPSAPFAPVEDNDGHTYIAQVVESYENEDGEDIISINLGGEVVTFEGEVIHTDNPLAPVLNEDGEMVVAETVTKCKAERKSLIAASLSDSTEYYDNESTSSETETETETETDLVATQSNATQVTTGQFTLTFE